MAEFLFEIGLEEIPARMIAGAQAELERRVVAMLERERLVVPGVQAKSFSTPRRLAVWVGEVADRQQDLTEDLLGPSAKVAYKDGVPGPAALAFARKAGVPVEALKTVETPKGEYLQATVLKPGRTAAEVIVAELPKELTAIYWAKNMYWRAGRPERFVRPVRWLLALLGEAVVPVEFAGYTASNVTYGHRVLSGAAAITVPAPGSYEEQLKAAFVLADVEARRHTIRKALDRVCRTLPGTRWREDHALVDKLTHLTEWPTVIAGGFEPEYLALPEEVLVTVMRDHQNYFAVEDKEGKLAPHFLAVLNTQADASGEAVIRHGNARVLRARFNDARFFWEFDQRVSLVDRVALLEKVTFQKDLGSYAAKTERVRKVAASLAGLLLERGVSLDAEALDQAALLAKTDLTCELVKEFTELQGIVGGLYARSQDFGETIAAAIYDQYLPESMEDAVPRTVEGAILAIADKADTIAGMFSLGLEPTGSKDPFALRRAGNGIVKILIENILPLPLKLTELAGSLGTQPVTTESMLRFLSERVSFFLKDVKSQSYDVINAVINAGVDDLRYVVPRAEALTAIREGSEAASFNAVCSAFKRMKNILAQARLSGIVIPEVVLTKYLKQGAEEELDCKSKQVAEDVDDLRWKGRYKEAFNQIASLRPLVDAFFDEVMVMVPDVEVCANRLALLQRIVLDFSKIADFSEIVTQGG